MWSCHAPFSARQLTVPLCSFSRKTVRCHAGTPNTRGSLAGLLSWKLTHPCQSTLPPRQDPPSQAAAGNAQRSGGGGAL